MAGKSQQNDEPRQESAEDQVKAADAVNAEVQETVDKVNEQGFYGTEVDMTPNENYTVQGVASDPTNVPEASADPVSARREATNPDLLKSGNNNAAE